MNVFKCCEVRLVIISLGFYSDVSLWYFLILLSLLVLLIFVDLAVVMYDYDV